MLVKGIIKTIDYQGNTCTVRIPVLESAGNNTEVCLPATFAITPGIYNGYKVNDVVFVGFEDNMLSSPVVFGKLFLGADEENKDPRGAINTESFKAKEPISIPLDTKLVLNNNPKKLTTVRVKNGLSDYKTIADIIKGLQHQNKEIGSLDAKLIDDGEKLGAEISKKVPTNSGDVQRGLSWYLTTDKWEIDANDTTDLGLQKLPLVTIDRAGMAIYGNLKIVGYSLGEELKYAKSQDPNHAPDGPGVQWQDSTAGLWQEGWYIWKRTRIIKWYYNETTDVWERKYNNPSYECITGATGSTGISINAFNYWYLAYPKNSTPVLDEPFTEPPTSDLGTKIWQNTPPSSTADTDDLWVVVESIFEDDTPEARHFTYNTPVLDTTYALAQGKSTNYYSDTDPSLTHLVKDGDCWFDTNIELGKLHNIEDYINTYVLMPVEQNGETIEQAIKITAENITDPNIYNFLNNWAPQTVVHINYVINENTGEKILPESFHPEDYFVKLDHKFIDLVRTAIMYKEDIKTYGRSSVDYEDRFVYIGREKDSTTNEWVNKWRKQTTINNEFVDTEFIVYTNDIARQYSPSDPRIIFTITQEQLDDDIHVNVIAYDENPLDPVKANYLKQWVGAPSGTPSGDGHWEDVGGEIVANKVTAAYVNTLGITAKRIHVLDANNNTLFLADADHPDDTQLGGLKVEENKLTFKEQDEQNSFKLETGNSGYVCYRSTNHHIAEHTSTSLIWIRVLEPIDSLTIYIRSNGNPDYDYCMATDTNTYYSNLPTQADDPHVVAHTKSNPQAGTTLESYTPVTYTNLAANSRFFVLYQKNSTSSDYEDYGYVLFNAVDLQKLELSLDNDDAVDYIIPFERYDTTDIDYKKTELLIGKKFKVDGDGNLSTANTTVNGRIDTQVLALNGLRLDTDTGTTQLNIEYYKLAYKINYDSLSGHYYFDYTVTCVDYNNIIRPITQTKTLRLSYILCYHGTMGGYTFATNTVELTFTKDTFIIQGSIDIGDTSPEIERSTATVSPGSNKTQINFRNSIGSFADSKNCVFKDYELFPSDGNTAAAFFSLWDNDGAGHRRILDLDLAEFLAEENWKKIYWVHCEVVNRASGGAPTLDDIKSKYTYYTAYILGNQSYMADPALWTGIIYPQDGTTFSWLIGQDLRTDSTSSIYGLEVEYNWQNPAYDPSKATIAYIKIMVYGER